MKWKSMGQHLSAWVLAFVGSPLAVTLPLLLTLGITASWYDRALIACFAAAAGLLGWVWYLFFRRSQQDSWGKRLLPILLALIYYAGLWALCLWISHYNYASEVWLVFCWLTPPYLVPNVFFALGSGFTLFPLMPLWVTIVSLAAMLLGSRKQQPRPKAGKGLWLLLGVTAAVCLFTGLQYYVRTAVVITNDRAAEKVEEGISYYQYRPFSGNGLLVELPEEPTLRIDRDYPRLDGATAAYPVYAVMAQEIYQGLDERTAEEYVQCSQTDQAYERLIQGEVDILFGAQPSAQQMAMAEEKGVELELLPVAKEAFVFFVNRENPVSDLTLEQIRDIYTKKITNWQELGGNNEAITPFQRPENSGSQTIMLAKVMQGTPLPEPLREEYADTMGGIVNAVAAYRNDTSAIGYSFRYFAAGMHPNENIKLLAINGTLPSIENIQKEKYPFTVEVYAVTAGKKSENTQRLLDWVLSEQGQELIELCGYVRR